jgi:hypothetical protein
LAGGRKAARFLLGRLAIPSVLMRPDILDKVISLTR